MQAKLDSTHFLFQQNHNTMELFSIILIALAVWPRAVLSRPHHDGTPAPSDEPQEVDQRWLRGLTSIASAPTPSFDENSNEKARRFTLQVRTTLLNVNVDDLTPEEIIYFEDTWVRVFNQILFGSANDPNDSSSSLDESFPRLRSFVVEDVLNDERRLYQNEQDGRALKRRGGRVKWFDMWALVETSCKLCADDRRALKDNAIIVQKLETTLCDELRKGPFRCFQDLDECRIIYIEE